MKKSDKKLLVKMNKTLNRIRAISSLVLFCSILVTIWCGWVGFQVMISALAIIIVMLMFETATKKIIVELEEAENENN